MSESSLPPNSCAPWTVCGGGTFVSAAGSLSSDRACSPCGSGTFASGSNQAGCSKWLTCTAGKYATTSGTATGDRSCSACEPGTFSTLEDTAACTICQPGTWSDTIGATACTDCPAGRYLTDPGTAETLHGSVDKCLVCSAGKFSDTPAAAFCTDCPPGKYLTDDGTDANLHDGIEKCQECQRPEYCLAGGTCAPNREGLGCAKCQERFFVAASGFECVPCPGPESDILVGILLFIGICAVLYFLYDLFDRSELDRDKLYKKKKQASNADKDRSVEVSRYKQAAGKNGKRMRRRSSTTQMGNVHGVSFSARTSIIGKTASVLFSHFVVLNFFMPSIPLLYLPEWFVRMMKVVVNFVTVDVIKLASSPDCQFRFTILEKYLMTSCLPHLLLFVSVLWWICARWTVKFRNWRQGTAEPFEPRPIYATVFLVFLSFLYPIMFHRIISAWDCTTNVADKSSTLDADPSIACSLDNEAWGELLLVSVLLFLVYIVVPALAFCSWVLGWKVRCKRSGRCCKIVPSVPIPEWLDDHSCPHFDAGTGPCHGTDCDACTNRKVFGYTFEKYRRQYFAWELVVLIRKMFVAGTTLFLSTRYDLRLPAEILCNTLYLVGLVRCLPYLTDHEVARRRESLEEYEDKNRYVCTSCLSCCKGMANLRRIRSVKEFNEWLDRVGVNNMLDALLTVAEIFLGASAMGTLFLMGEIEREGWNRRPSVQNLGMNSSLSNGTAVTVYVSIDSFLMAQHFPVPHAFVGIFEWLGGISLMLGLFYFIFLLWTFAKELWAEKCGKACRVKGCGKEKKGGGGLEMVGSWKQQATTNPLFQSGQGKNGGHASV